MAVLNLFASIFRRSRNPRKPGRRIPGVYKVRDIAITFRMAAGFAGDVNRSHPANIEPTLIDAANPPTAYGQLVIGDTVSQGVRPLIVGTDAGTSCYGVTTRPYPTQQTTGGMSAALGAGVPPVSGVTDVIKNGYVLVPCNTSNGTPTKFAPVYVWIAAASGTHFPGGFEAVANGGNTALLANAMWNGAPDATGIAELILNF